MGQEQVEFQSIIREPSLAFNLYVWFLLIVCVVTAAKLIKLWIAVPPFRRSAKANNPEYLRLLEAACRSLKHWIGAVFLGYGILFSNSLYNVCKGLLYENHTGPAAILFVVQDYALGLGMAVYVATFAYLASWHVQSRIERFGRPT
jgi:hypothetical protein